MTKKLAEGSYVSILFGPTSYSFSLMETPMNTKSSTFTTVTSRIRTSIIQYRTDTIRCAQAELFPFTSFNLILQVNCIGPSLHEEGLVQSAVRTFRKAVKVYRAGTTKRCVVESQYERNVSFKVGYLKK